MQFIKNGPDIPERLLQAHEEGRVVFFCGAGISYPARLPGFGGLVNKLYAGLGEVPSPVEQAAIKREQFDTAIGLLEGRIIGGRATVRPQLATALTPDLTAPQAMATHEAMLTLARCRNGRYRLITTNFDRLFEEVIAKNSLPVQTFRAPLLPLPKNRWDGLVYLHGLLPPTPTSSDLDRLVVSSGDFGLAYLTERWAARFVSELFRNYTVCFVGYSINDPVLRYMMDALAADRLMGEAPTEVFALGSYRKGKESEGDNEWRAKNVTPILYSEHRHHIYLHRTLRAWAETYRDGVLGRERIVVQYAMTKPLSSTQQDDFVGRMLWALSDPKALPAKRFAELDPPPPLDWLGPLTDKRFRHWDLSRFGLQPYSEKDEKLAFSVTIRPTPYTLAPWMKLVHNSWEASCQWDAVMTELARWLSRHIHDAKLILWVVKHGGTLHPQFAAIIGDAINQYQLPLPIKILWKLILSGRLRTQDETFDLYDWLEKLKLDGFTFALRSQFRELLKPKVVLREPFRFMEDETQKEGGEPLHIKDFVDWEIFLSTDYVSSALKDSAQNANWRAALPKLLSDATMLLRDALDLMRELGGADDRNDGSYHDRPSISDHPQNKDYRDWTALIDIVRDAWLATVSEFPERARLEAELWLDIPYPLFRRLAFFSATNSDLFTPQQALNWLLSDDQWWLWSVETQREALRLLYTIAPKLNTQDLEVLYKSILHGPPLKMYREDVDELQLQQAINRETWLRLAKCLAAGARLSADADAKFHDLSLRYPTWHLADDDRDEFPVWSGGVEDWRTFLATPKRFGDLVNWLREHPQSSIWQGDDWRERCKRDFRRTAVALIELARQHEWLDIRWREALQVWADETLTTRSWLYVRNTLATAPDEVIKELANPISWWLQSIAKTFTGNDDAFFTLIRRLMGLFRDEAFQGDDDPVYKAINHPIGHITEAALSWWYRKELQDNQGLDSDLHPLFTGLCDTDVPVFRHGRLLLSTHVIALFRVDCEWTKQFLLPLFNWSHSEGEALSAWIGFLWSPRLYPPLVEAIKIQFLDTANHYMDLGKYGDQYAALITFAALEQKEILSRPELAKATRALPAAGLVRAVLTLESALESAGERRSEYWKNRILPYLKAVWPKSREIIIPAMTRHFASLCIAAGDAFPEAFDELKHWLSSLDSPGYVVRLLRTARLCSRFPEECLAFLDIIVGDHVRWTARDLMDCLNDIRSAQSEIETDDRFMRLHELLRRFIRT